VFRRKRGDTTVESIERQYGVDLNARGDMLLDNLLEERGFDSVTQLLQAFHGRLTEHGRRRRLFISFHKEDARQLGGFRLMARNPRVALEFYDGSLKDAIDSANKTYVKQVIRELINRASVVVCLVGNGTGWRDWVEWELETAVSLKKGICGVRIPATYGKIPTVLRSMDAMIADWDAVSMIKAIEYAAARRSQQD
jgi:hypothetical protein